MDLPFIVKNRIRSKQSLGTILFSALLISAGLVAQPQAAPQIELTPIASGLGSPVAITHAGDGSGRLFITLQTGQVLIHDGQQLLPTPFLDIAALITAGGERGLFSVAFHPNFSVNGLIYVNYTDLNGDTVVARYAVSADPNVVDPASATILLNVPQPFANHNGGQLQFGPDGYLYIGMGDGGSGGDPQNNAQNLASLLGKMLRIDVDGGPPYGIPPDNPFIGDPAALPEIWALGLRNPWRFSFDRLTGDLFIADVGQNRFEEVNFQAAGSTGGENYGWRLMEADSCFNPASNCNDGSLTLPILQYDHSVGCSISGGYRYRGADHPGLAGLFFYADFCTGRIWTASQDAGGLWVAEELLDTELQVTAFGEDEGGEIYLASFGSNVGSIFRISEVPASTPTDPGPAPPTAGDGGGGGGGGCFISSIVK
jgi:glucose/arabinose dehydrogenase